MKSVCTLYVGVMAASSYLSLYADKLFKGENQSNFPIGILGQVWYLIVSIPDLCTLTYFYIYSSPCQYEFDGMS